MDMNTNVIIFTKGDDKKHSTRYNGVTNTGAPVSFYIPHSALPTPAPQRVQVTIQPLPPLNMDEIQL